MEMQFIVSGVGLGVSGVTVSTLKTAMLFFRDSPDEGAWGLKVRDFFDLGSGPHALGSAVISDWVPLNPSKDEWLFNPLDLIGRTGEIKVPGTTVFAGATALDLIFQVINENHRVENNIQLKNVPVRKMSYQIGGFSVEGTIVGAEPPKEVFGGEDDR